ncbi:MAG TPA: winged helix-turn-helix domain-containing protein [Bryobacteraceae bacterium]|nr:winged helix-turn-helix domain-containing protein [Bryobacteraceae bacterium]
MSTLAACFQFDDVEVRPSTFEVLKAGRVLALEPKAIRVLMYLIENRDRAVSKEEILTTVWEGSAVTDNALTRIVAQLRRELGDDARSPRYIQTIPTLGYRFVGDLTPSARTVPAERSSNRRLPLVIGAACLALAAAIAATNFAPRRHVAAPVRGGATMQFTTSPGLDMGATFSPDGQTLAFSSNRTGRFEIYIRPLRANAREVRITSDGKQNMEPVWSPDGRSIAFYSVARNGICILPSVGGEIRQLTNFGSSPAWSPDSKKIVFRSTGIFSVTPNDALGNGMSTIWEVSAEGGSPRQLTQPGNPEGTHGFPAWSPRGDVVVFSNVSAGRQAGLYRVNPQTGAVRAMLPADKKTFLTPVLSSDGKWIYYTAFSPSRDFGIWRMPLHPTTGERAGDPVEIARTGSSLPRTPAVSRDGKRLAYTYSNMTSQLWTVPVKGGPAKPLYREAVFRSIHPTFSPDGSRISLSAIRFGTKADLWMINADGTDAAPVSTEPEPEFEPVWSADGRSIFFSLQRESRTEIWQHAIEGGLRHKIWEEGGILRWPRISRSGTFVLYQTGKPGNLWRWDIGASSPRQLTFDREGAGFPSISYDERWVAYELNRGEHTHLAIMDATGGPSKTLVEEPGQVWSRDWSPDNRRIVYAGFRDAAWNIWWIDRITGERRKLTDFTSLDTYVRYPAWSPRNDQIVFELGSTKGNIYLLDLP